MPKLVSENIINTIRSKNQSIKDKDTAIKEFKKKIKKEDKDTPARGVELFF